MRCAPDPDLCAECGNRFPPGQVCSQCVGDAAALRCAAAVIRSRAGKRGFRTEVIIRVLLKHAEHIELDARTAARAASAHPGLNLRSST